MYELDDEEFSIVKNAIVKSYNYLHEYYRYSDSEQLHYLIADLNNALSVLSQYS